MSRKIFHAFDNDFDVYGDCLIGAAVNAFIKGSCTHVQDGNNLMEAEIVTFQDGTKGVMIGECADD